jgi:hypothetical protein
MLLHLFDFTISNQSQLMTVTDSQFDYLLALAFTAVDNGLQRKDIVPSEVYQWIQDDTLQNVWDALTVKEQEEVCYDLRDNVFEGEMLGREYFKSDEYMELQYR